MSSHPTVSEIAENFAEYIDRVVHHGERFVLMQGKESVAELRPVTPGRRLLRELPALLASLPRLSPEDLDSFESDLSDAREDLDRFPIREPWEP